jgi:hypothetical protein
MLRSTFCALQVDAGRRLIWITLCWAESAARGRANSSPQPRSGLNCFAVRTGGLQLHPRAAPAACTGLSALDAFRRRLPIHIYMPYVTSVNEYQFVHCPIFNAIVLFFF